MVCLHIWIKYLEIAKVLAQWGFHFFPGVSEGAQEQEPLCSKRAQESGPVTKRQGFQTAGKWITGVSL